jgi:hypothetical protein
MSVIFMSVIFENLTRLIGPFTGKFPNRNSFVILRFLKSKLNLQVFLSSLKSFCTKIFGKKGILSFLAFAVIISKKDDYCYAILYIESINYEREAYITNLLYENGIDPALIFRVISRPLGLSSFNAVKFIASLYFNIEDIDDLQGPYYCGVHRNYDREKNSSFFKNWIELKVEADSNADVSNQ